MINTNYNIKSTTPEIKATTTRIKPGTNKFATPKDLYLQINKSCAKENKTARTIMEALYNGNINKEQCIKMLGKIFIK